MTSIWIQLPVIAGFIAGALHVLSGPDHLAAVAPIALRSHGHSWMAGLRWGLGHSAGVALVGVMLLAFRDTLPIKELSHGSERLVGVVLVCLGIWTWRSASRVQIHTHEHKHDGDPHVHVHLHSPTHRHGEIAEAVHPVHCHTAFGIGTLHGLAGGSHLLGVVPALAMPGGSALIYLASFTMGTVVAMVIFSLGIGWMADRSRSFGHASFRALVQTGAAAAIGVGVWWLFQAV